MQKKKCFVICFIFIVLFFSLFIVGCSNKKTTGKCGVLGENCIDTLTGTVAGGKSVTSLVVSMISKD